MPDRRTFLTAAVAAASAATLPLSRILGFSGRPDAAAAPAPDGTQPSSGHPGTSPAELDESGRELRRLRRRVAAAQSVPRPEGEVAIP